MAIKVAPKHYILTRFNAGVYSNPSSVPNRLKQSDDWMEHRLPLFEKFTLPSIMNQSCQNFSWHLLVDKQTPKRFIHRIEKFDYPNIKIRYTDIDIYAPTISDTKIWGINTYKHDKFNIITTRIDNDDAFHINYIKEIQNRYTQLANESKPFIISFPLGYIVHLKSNSIVSHRYRKNNCPSLVASCNRKTFKSVFCCQHFQLAEKYVTFYAQKHKPHWLLIIHSQNLGNQKLLKYFTNSNKMEISNSIKREFYGTTL